MKYRKSLRFIFWNLSQNYEQLDCIVISTSHVKKIKIKSFECDSKTRKQLDKILKARLINKFIEHGNIRLIHCGTFEWYESSEFGILGRLEGITNSGSDHHPLEKECEKCNRIHIWNADWKDIFNFKRILILCMNIKFRQCILWI